MSKSVCTAWHTLASAGPDLGPWHRYMGSGICSSTCSTCRRLSSLMCSTPCRVASFFNKKIFRGALVVRVGGQRAFIRKMSSAPTPPSHSISPSQRFTCPRPKIRAGGTSPPAPQRARATWPVVRPFAGRGRESPSRRPFRSQRSAPALRRRCPSCARGRGRRHGHDRGRRHQRVAQQARLR